MKIAVFLGAPGSGKGTQAKRLAEKHGFTHFSTGDMLRSAVSSGTETGQKAKVYLDKGELVPDDVMIELIEGALGSLASNASVLLDGFPRTVPQARSLDSGAKTTVASAIYFVIPEPILIRRLTGRRICPKCGESYHTEFMAPKQAGVCNHCSGALIQRTDDGEDVVRRRLQIFSEQNEGLLNYYTSTGKLKKLDADRSVELIQKDLLSLLG